MIYRFGDFELNEERFELRRRGARVAVQPKVLRLLLFLVRARARAVGRAELLQAIWSDAKVADDSLARGVLEARRAIGDEKHEIIVTVRGMGFRFAAPVTEITEGDPQPAESQRSLDRHQPLLRLWSQISTVLAGRVGSTVTQPGERSLAPRLSAQRSDLPLNAALPLETAAPPRNFSIPVEQRIRAIAIGAPAYARRKRAIEDLEASILRTLAEQGTAAAARGLDAREHARARAPIAALERLADLVERHNRWYPIEANLPIHPRSAQFLERTGEPWTPMRVPTLEDLLDRVFVGDASRAAPAVKLPTKARRS